MYVKFEDMPKTARVWVYQADRVLNAEEVSAIQNSLEHFVAQWTAHKKSLKASAKVFYERFIVLSVDENHSQASGCSIDASVHFIQEIEKHFQINLMDRTQQAILNQNKISTLALKDIKDSVAKGVIEPNTLVFNNLVKDIEELESIWKQPAKESWLKKYF